MLLQVLHKYAVDNHLLEGIAFAPRVVHLALVLREDGQVDPASPWRLLGEEYEGKKGEKRFKLGRPLLMPRFPGENNGGKAYFLAEKAEAIFGIDPTTGSARPDTIARGQERGLQNGIKAFGHFWQRIQQAYAATGSTALAPILAFRDRFLASESVRAQLLTRSDAFLAMTEVAKGKGDPIAKLCAIAGAGPTPVDGTVITFEVDGLPVLDADPGLFDYWNAAYARESFAQADDSDEPTVMADRRVGLCLVTGEDGQPIAGSHKPEIKGVPGLPAKGGYLISFAKESPSLESYGFSGSFNAPISDRAAARYALALNHLLSRDQPFARTINNEFVVCSWVRDDPDLSLRVNGATIEPDNDQFGKLIDDFAHGRFAEAILAEHFHSITLAANGGRVVVRRWLDVPLGVVLANLRTWKDQLELDEVPRSTSGAKRGRKPTKAATPSAETHPITYRALDSLAATTARIPSEVPSSVFDTLYRAALEGESLDSLLPAVLNRLRIAATNHGANIRFDTSRFALIKLILLRCRNRETQPMNVERHLCVTNDEPYNCGRLLALLDSMQYVAQGEVGADVVSRFYANASSFPGNVFPRLLRLEKHHRAKALKRNDEARAAAHAIGGRIDDVMSLFPPGGPLGFPQFPHLLTPIQQGRFALGFHQQKAADQQDKNARYAANQAAAMAGSSEVASSDANPDD